MDGNLIMMNALNLFYCIRAYAALFDLNAMMIAEKHVLVITSFFSKSDLLRGVKIECAKSPFISS